MQGSDQELPLATMPELVVYRSETTPAVARLAPKQGNFLHGLLSRSGDMFSQTHAVNSMVGECVVNWCTTAHGVLLASTLKPYKQAFNHTIRPVSSTTTAKQGSERVSVCVPAREGQWVES